MTIDDAIDTMNDLDDLLDSDDVNAALEKATEQEREDFVQAKLDLEHQIEVLETNRLRILADDLDANEADLNAATAALKKDAKEIDEIAKIIADIGKVIAIAGKIAAHI